MAVIAEINEQGFKEWLSGRPQVIKDLATKIPPGRLYLLKTSNHRVFPYSYSENGTINVIVSGQYNSLMFERRVFGILPEDLEECDFPASDEVLGAFLTNEEDIDAFGKMLRSNL